MKKLLRYILPVLLVPLWTFGQASTDRNYVLRRLRPSLIWYQRF
ncbi:hypothetical protein [Chitinophaga oryziterrae]|nr:hypothetical protein [Chitinophaga oryziterrae]